MNRYGPRPCGTGSGTCRPATAVWRTPAGFFADLGEQADAEIEDRYLEYAGQDIPGESAEDKQVRLTRAMSRATEEVHAELVTPSPASQGESAPETPWAS